jgi:hypothetical protein
MDTEQQRPDEMGHAPVGEGETLEACDLSVVQRIGVLALNALPLAHVAGVAWIALWPWAAVAWRLPAALGALYLLPPLVARAIVKGFPFRATVIKPGTADFFKWWTLLCLQTVFCRFPALEEAMRLVPALYSAWLRLWGSRIGRLVYWAPGLRVLDRSFLDVGDDVVFGAAVRLNPHVMARNEKGELQLVLAPVKIGARAVIGGYALLTAGTEIPAYETTRACLLSAPFTRWQGGRRVRE